MAVSDVTLKLERKIAHYFRMTEEAWARHADPWSGWTRNTCLPLLIIAIWSRAWLSWFVDRMVWLYEDMKDATPEV